MEVVEFWVLLAASASLGVMHTLLGPDHYIPFVMMGKAGQWSLRKTCLITAFCGVGHVAGSMVLGLLGIGAGIGLQKIELIDSFRGNAAAWLFISFGLVYFIWGLKKAFRKHQHTHDHMFDGLSGHSHFAADGKHLQPSPTDGPPTGKTDTSSDAGNRRRMKSMGIWVLFVIFVLGPCEPLIPLLMYPAAKHSLMGVMGVSAAFLIFTVATMVTVVAFAYRGITSFKWGSIERYSHAAAGFTLLFCGVSIAFLGL